MSLTSYDLQTLRQLDVPPESLSDWGALVMERDLETAQVKMIAFYRNWGDRFLGGKINRIF